MNNEEEIHIIQIAVPKTDSKEEIEKFIKKMKTALNDRNKGATTKWNPLSGEEDFFTAKNEETGPQG